jgi:hypothetical protein
MELSHSKPFFVAIYLIGCDPRLFNVALMTSLITGTITRSEHSATNSCHRESLPTTSVTSHRGSVALILQCRLPRILWKLLGKTFQNHARNVTDGFLMSLTHRHGRYTSALGHRSSFWLRGGQYFVRCSLVFSKATCTLSTRSKFPML